MRFRRAVSKRRRRNAKFFADRHAMQAAQAGYQRIMMDGVADEKLQLPAW